jgi:hypothetical protein
VKRWVIAAAFILAPALFLLHLPERQRAVIDEAPSDEILAYEIGPSQSVTVTVPGGQDALLVTTWAVVPGGQIVDPDERLPYAFDLTELDGDGREVASRTYHVESRLSTREGEGESRGGYAARLADGDDVVTDSRTTALERSEQLSRGGFLRLSNRGVSGPSLLARLAFRDPRGAIARAAFEASLTVQAKRHVVANRSSLGFADLTESARELGLASVGTRLSAIGREDVDYALRRLLLGDFRGTLAPAPRKDQGFDVGSRHWAALNFGGPVLLRFLAPPFSRFRIREGASGERVLDTGENGWSEAMMSGETPRTVVLASDSPADVHVRCVVDRDGVRAQLGDVHPRIAGDGRFEIGEDLRMGRFARLDPTVPVVVRLLPGQRALRVTVRGEIAAAEATEIDAKVEARFDDGPHTEERASFQAALPRSKFDRWRRSGIFGARAQKQDVARDATDPHSETLPLPAHVDEVRLFGEPNLLVKIFVPEPGIEADQIRAPYRVTLGEGEAWRNAPYDIRTWAPVAPSNETELDRVERVADLLAQVRIEREGVPGPVKRPERLLPPEGTPIHRRLLLPAVYAPGTPMALDGWSALDRERELEVDAKGPRAGSLEVIYRAAKARLGKQAHLLVDGADVARQTLVVPSGTLRAAVPAGKHRVEVQGIGEGGTAWADAAPARGGAIVRRRDVYELDHRRPLEFRIAQEAGEILHVVLFIATEGIDRPFRLRYSLDGGRPQRVTGRFVRVTTSPQGELVGRSGDLSRGLLWEADERSSSEGPFPHGLSWGKVHLGNDLRAGTHELTLSLDPLSEPVWVRAVLVGRSDDLPEPETRLWPAEAP